MRMGARRISVHASCDGGVREKFSSLVFAFLHACAHRTNRTSSLKHVDPRQSWGERDKRRKKAKNPVFLSVIKKG